MHLQTFPQPACLGRGAGLLQRRWLVCVEVLPHQHDGVGLRRVPIDQRANHMGKVSSRTTLCDLHPSWPCQRLEDHAQIDRNLLQVALAPELAGGGIGKAKYHEIGGFWSWTLAPYFDIWLAGNIAIPGEAGDKDLARLATCNGRPCQGDDVALAAEASVRARFLQV